MSILSGLYGRAAEWRRAWYDRRDRRVELARPVISVGNVVIGGSGKTPTVAALARLLRSRGERPAILSRGYGRRAAVDGVLVVSDGERVLEPTTRSGGEPQMLARSLRGVPVLVARQRLLAGRLAERRFDVTVHLLDDGFQHLPLARDVDLVIVSPADLDERVLPAGRLREPVAAARHADALLVPGHEEDARLVGSRIPASPSTPREMFNLSVWYEDVKAVGVEAPRPGGSGRRVLAVCGIARPERFVGALRSSGWDVVREMVFRDHHWFSARDAESIARAAAAAGVDLIVTTEKDATRLSVPNLYYLPMHVTIEPADRFADWLAGRLRVARARRGIAA